MFARLEEELRDGPLFAGETFSLVDSVFAPVFRYFDGFETFGDFGILAGKPRVAAWRKALAARPSVKTAVVEDFPERLLRFFEARRGVLVRGRLATWIHWKIEGAQSCHHLVEDQSGRVTGGSARARQPARSQTRQAGPTGVDAMEPDFPVFPVAAAGRAAP